MEKRTLIVTKNDHDRRLDKILRKIFPDLPLSLIYKYLRKGNIKVNGKKAKPDKRVMEGDELLMAVPNLYEHLTVNKNKEANPKAKEVLEPHILYENEHILAVNKPRGLLIHGRRSLDEIVGSYLANRLNHSLAFKPGPIHRLDRNTSGLVFFSASLDGAREFAEIFKSHSCEKYYVAILDGVLDRSQLWIDNLERDEAAKKTLESEETGKEAKTRAIPIFIGKHHTLALIKIATGRTHQIRTQAAIHRHPLTGDNKYRGSEITKGYLLHALAFKLKKHVEIVAFNSLVAPLPASAEATIKNLFNTTAIKKILPILREEMAKKRF